MILFIFCGQRVFSHKIPSYSFSKSKLKSRYITLSVSANTTQSNITQFFPLTCCKDIEQFITVTDINKNAVNVSKVPYDFAEKCYNKASPHVNEKGARDDVKGLLITLLILSLIGMLIVIGIQVFLVWAAFKVYNSI